MNKCLEDCNIKDKLSECCGMHPESLRTKLMLIDDEILKVCPAFSSDGTCLDYENKPKLCMNYECLRLKEKVYEIAMENN